MKRHLLAVVSLTGITAVSALLYAQEGGNQPAPQQGNQQQDGNRQGGGGGGERGEWQARMAERIKGELALSEEEWQVLQPKFEKVTTLQRQTRMGFGGRGGGGGGGGGQNNDESPVGKATAALRTTLENKSASADEIKSKVTALREARKTTESELKTAREDLRSLVTQRQEASLVVMGILD